MSIEDELINLDLLTGIVTRLDENKKGEISQNDYNNIISSVRHLGYNIQADLIEVFYSDNNLGHVVETAKTVIRLYVNENKPKQEKSTF